MAAPVPQDALDYFNAKQLKPSFDYRDVWKEEHAFNFTVAKAMQLDILEDIQQGIASALAEGKTFAQFQKELKPLLEAKGWWGKKEMLDPLTGKTINAQLGSPRRLKVIYDSNLRTARAAQKWQLIQRTKQTMPYLLYQLGPSAKHRDAHVAINNTLLPVDDSFWGVYYPPNGYNCFTPDSLVTGDFEIGLKSFYSGKVFKFTTRSGACFTVTANHPILSEHGWVEAKTLNKGDNLLRYTGVVDADTPVIVNNQNSPATAKEWFESLARDAFGICKMSSFDFHGDTKFRKGDVYVSGADCVLMDNFIALPLEQLEQGHFKWADDGGIERETTTNRTSASNVSIRKRISSDDGFYHWSGTACPIDYLSGTKSFCVQMNNLFFKSIIPIVRSLPSRLALSLNCVWVKFHGFPFQSTRLTHGASGNASIFQYSSDGESTHAVSGGNELFTFARKVCGRNRSIIKLFFSDAISGKSVLFNELPKKKSADSVTFTDFMKRHHRQVVIDDIISIEESFYSGHVYTFQSKNEIIIANGIITHNCKCWVRQISNHEYESLAGNNDYNTESPPIEYENWLNKRTGEIEKVPKGVQPGWDTNPGISRKAALDKLLGEKATATTRFTDKLMQSLTALRDNIKQTVKKGLREALGDLAKAINPVSLPGINQAALDYVLKNGRKLEKARIEFAYLYDANGEKLFSKQGRFKNVGFTEEECLLMKNATLVHNHPTGLSLSLKDLMLQHQWQMTEIVAVGHNNVVYRAAVIDGKRLTTELYSKISNNIRAKISPLIKSKELSLSEANLLHCHLQNLILDRAGVIKYTVENAGVLPKTAKLSGFINEQAAIVRNKKG